MDKVKNTSKARRILRFIASMLVGGTIGYVFASGIMEEVLVKLNWKPSLYYEYDIMFGLLAILACVLSLWNIAALTRVKGTAGEPANLEESISPRGRLIEMLLKISSYNVIITMLWSLLAAAHALAPGGKESADADFMLGNMIASVCFLIIAGLLQIRILTIFNKYYPERKLDLWAGTARQAQRELFAKMDEGEQWIVYRSAYSAFRATSFTLILGIVLLALHSSLFGFTPLPMIVLAVILMVQQATYYHEVSKYSK